MAPISGRPADRRAQLCTQYGTAVVGMPQKYVGQDRKLAISVSGRSVCPSGAPRCKKWNGETDSRLAPNELAAPEATKWSAIPQSPLFLNGAAGKACERKLSLKFVSFRQLFGARGNWLRHLRPLRPLRHLLSRLSFVRSKLTHSLTR